VRWTLPLLVFVAVLSTGAAQAAPVSHTITMSSIGGLRLGLTASQYRQELGGKTFVTRYSDGTSRLLSGPRDLAVYLGVNGRGYMISTSDIDYRLRGGGGPCGSLATLPRTRTVVERRLPGQLRNAPVLYRVGRLWFTIGAPGHIGSVALVDGVPSVSTLLGLARCGTGEEGPEG
jgi:hypothetical protein